MDLDVIRTVVETNVLGVVRVTNAMLPLLRRSPSPRIVNVSSSVGSLARQSGSVGESTAGSGGCGLLPLEDLPQRA